MDYGVMHTKKCSLALKYAESQSFTDALSVNI